MKKEVMNAVIKSMAKNQNAKSKLNAGQLREAATLVFKAIRELSAEQKLAAVKSM